MAYQRGTGFVGLQQYLGANEEQAKKMGQGITDQVNTEGQAAQGAIDTASQAVEAQAAAGTPTYEPLPDAQNLPGTADLYNYGKMQQATYKGPKALGDVADTTALTKQAAGAQQTAQLAGTDAGRATMLAKSAQGSYGLGARSLDAYLAGRGGGQALEQATSKYAKLQDYLGTAEKTATARGERGVADAAAVQEQYRTAPTLPLTYGGGDRIRNPIQTPGTMPEPQPGDGSYDLWDRLTGKKRRT